MTAAQRGRRSFFAVMLMALLLGSCFAALGTWQLARRAWKVDLIARVEARIHAPPTPLPMPAPGDGAWPQVTAARDEYLHVRATGVFLHERETLVQAATELGSGHWVLTPLQLADGSSVLVNRGFVAPALRDRATRAAGESGGPVTVTGLLRLTEPGGGFLRRNDAAANRWHSRDVQAIAAARGMKRAAPYFIDADAAAPPASAAPPVGGLTVTSFPNNHLAYALTWYALAVMSVAAGAVLVSTGRLSPWSPQRPDFQ